MWLLLPAAVEYW